MWGLNEMTIIRCYYRACLRRGLITCVGLFAVLTLLTHPPHLFCAEGNESVGTGSIPPSHVEDSKRKETWKTKTILEGHNMSRYWAGKESFHKHVWLMGIVKIKSPTGKWCQVAFWSTGNVLCLDLAGGKIGAYTL